MSKIDDIQKKFDEMKSCCDVPEDEFKDISFELMFLKEELKDVSGEMRKTIESGYNMDYCYSILDEQISIIEGMLK